MNQSASTIEKQPNSVSQEAANSKTVSAVLSVKESIQRHASSWTTKSLFTNCIKGRVYANSNSADMSKEWRTLSTL